MAFIFTLSSISQTPSLPGQSDKGLHGLLYAGLAALLMRALAGAWSRPMTLGAIIATVAISALYGISDEYHQSFVPSRQSDPVDVVADTVGATIGAIACLAWSRSYRQHRSSRPV